MTSLPYPDAETWRTLPAETWLAHARQVQTALQAGTLTAQHKDATELVTAADTALQQMILQHWAASGAAGQYAIWAEEELGPEWAEQPADPDWYLLVDPIDGTSAFARGEDQWGTMVGGLNRDGSWRASWNVTAGGEMYTNWGPAPRPAATPLAERETVQLLYCDYGAGGEPAAVAAVRALTQRPVTTVVVPAAVCEGAALTYGRADALLWVASGEGKRTYPLYDLVYLGALTAQGWVVRLGFAGRDVMLVVVAATVADAEALVKVGRGQLRPEHRLERVAADFRGYFDTKDQ